jgi:hypothetical protein
MGRRAAERGSGNVGCILWLIVLVVGVLIAWKAIPVKIKTAEFYDSIEEMAKFSGSNPPDALKKQILDKANELQLPVDKDHVKVQRIGDRIRMEVDYTVPLDFPGYTYEWHFDHQVDRPIFIF